MVTSDLRVPPVCVGSGSKFAGVSSELLCHRLSYSPAIPGTLASLMTITLSVSVCVSLRDCLRCFAQAPYLQSEMAILALITSGIRQGLYLKKGANYGNKPEKITTTGVFA